MVKIVEAVPAENYTIVIKLEDGRTGIFDVSQFIDKGVFQELRNENYFQQVRVRGRSIVWPHDQDFCADTIEVLMNPLNNVKTI